MNCHTCMAHRPSARDNSFIICVTVTAQSTEQHATSLKKQPGKHLNRTPSVRCDHLNRYNLQVSLTDAGQQICPSVKMNPFNEIIECKCNPRGVNKGCRMYVCSPASRSIAESGWNSCRLDLSPPQACSVPSCECLTLPVQPHLHAPRCTTG